VQLLAWGDKVRLKFNEDNMVEQVKAAASGNSAVTFLLNEVSSLSGNMKLLVDENKMMRTLIISQVS
jgi:hypothetical protein